MEKVNIGLLCIIIIVTILIIWLYRYNDECKQNVANTRLIKELPNNLKEKVVECYKYNLENYDDGKEHIFLSLKNNNIIAHKKHLWLTLKNHYGTEIAKTITPMTYIIPEDYVQLIKENDSLGSRLIYKQNNHQQNGIFVSDKIQDLQFLENNKFIIAQQFIKDTLKWYDYKLSFRLYLILECNTGKLRSHIYSDGLVYYGKGDIASFYYSDELYKNKFPILISELEPKMHLNLRKPMKTKLNMLIDAIKDKMCNGATLGGSKFFEIFGVDFHITNNLDAYILEVNSGPGMTDSESGNDTAFRNKLMKYYEEKLTK